MADSEPVHRKRRPRKTNMSGWFREIFTAEPGLLYAKTNEELINRWKEAHPKHNGKELLRARQSLANLKCLMRKSREAQGASRPVGKGGGAHTKLDHLADQIDECLALAKHIDREELRDVIGLLRRARNEVILKNG